MSYYKVPINFNLKVCIMKVLNIGVSNYTENNKPISFESTRLPKKWAIRQVSDETLKKVSAAIAASGVASLMLGESNEDYVNSIAVPIDRANLTPEAMSALKEGYQSYPVLMDMLVSETSRINEIRPLSENLIYKSIEAYEINADMTEQMLVEKDEKGNFKYRISDILNIVKANDINPGLLEISKKYPAFVMSVLNHKNEKGQPLYGLEDIKAFCEAREIDNDLTQKLLSQHYTNGNARFSGPEALFVVKNKKNKFLNYLLNQQNHGSVRFESVHRFDGSQIMELMKLCKTKENKELLKHLVNASIPDQNIVSLSADDIVNAIKYDSVALAKTMTHSSQKHKLTKILELKNEPLALRQILELAKLKNEFRQKVFTERELSNITQFNAIKTALKLADRNFDIKEMMEIEQFAFDNAELTDLIFEKTYHVKTVKESAWGTRTDKRSFKLNNDIAMKLLPNAEKTPDIVKTVLSFVDTTYFYDDKYLETELAELIFDCISSMQKLPKQTLDKYFKFVDTSEYSLRELRRELNWLLYKSSIDSKQ